jgi:hypothetical protein
MSAWATEMAGPYIICYHHHKIILYIKYREIK